MKYFLSVLLLLFSTLGFGKTLRVAFGDNRPPYVFEESKTLRGIEVDIVKEALLLSGHIVVSEKLPNKRLNLATTKMGYDVAVGVVDLKEPLFYSNDYLQIKNYAVSKAYKNIKLMSIADLSKHSVGAWPSAWNHFGDEYKKLFAPDANGEFSKLYFEPLNSEAQNKMFWRDRFDVAITNKVTFFYYKKYLASLVDTSPDVVFYDLIQDETKSMVAFRDEAIRNDFERGLHQLKRNKRYRRIFQYYAQGLQE